MAIDTEDKRRSAYISLGLYNIQPVADGSQGSADRAHNRWFYRGIAITAVVGRIRRRTAKGWQRIWFGT